MNYFPEVFNFEFQHDTAQKRMFSQILRLLDLGKAKLFAGLWIVATDECDQILQLFNPNGIVEDCLQPISESFF